MALIALFPHPHMSMRSLKVRSGDHGKVGPAPHQTSMNFRLHCLLCNAPKIARISRQAICPSGAHPVNAGSADSS